jgi:hypothetical protein
MDESRKQQNTCSSRLTKLKKQVVVIVPIMAFFQSLRNVVFETYGVIFALHFQGGYC